jgi:replicative DNA helicase
MGSLEEKQELDFIAQTNWERLTIHVAKNRNGVHGSVDLGWEAQSMTIHETDERWAA